MEFEVLSATRAAVTVRSFADGRDWSYGIVQRDGQRRMEGWVALRSSMDESLPTIAEAMPPYLFACQVAKHRGLLD